MQKRRHLRNITEMSPFYKDIKVAYDHHVGLISVQTERFLGGTQFPLQSTYLNSMRLTKCHPQHLVMRYKN